MTVKAISNSVEPQPQAAHDFWAVAAQGIAAVSALLVILVTLFLAQDVALRWGKDPLDSDAYRKLKAELAANPQSEELKSLIRDVDQQLREEYFRQRAFTARGSWLLLGGSALFLLAFRTTATLRRRLPEDLRRVGSAGHRVSNGRHGAAVGRRTDRGPYRCGIGSLRMGG